MYIKLEGKVIEVYDKQVISDKFSKKLFVIEVENGQYFNQYAVELHKDNCDLVSKATNGAQVVADCYVKSKHWKDDKYFTSIIAKAVKVLNASDAGNDKPVEIPVIDSGDADDSLPF